MKRALVTGANGFIGSHLVRELLARGYEVRCLVRKTSNLGSLYGLPVSITVGDLTDAASLDSAVRDMDYIYHLGAAVFLAGTARDYDHINHIGTVNLLEAALRHAPGLKRFLFASSGTVVGPGEGPESIDESAPMRPMTWYGTSKRDAELAVNSYSDRVPVTIVRPSSVYGEREVDLYQMYSLVDKRIHVKMGLRKKYLVMVYVKDLVEGMIDAAESSATIGQTYFLNHNEVVSSTDVVKSIARAMGKPAGVTIPVPSPTVKLMVPFAEMQSHITRARPTMTRDTARLMGERYWAVDASKAKRDFGWEARHDLQSGMVPTIAAYREIQRELRDMPLERGVVSWLKFALCAVALGTVFELVSMAARLYAFEPWYLVFAFVIGWFGLVLGTVAWTVRRTGMLVQFAAGTVVSAAAEALNLTRLHLWTFTRHLPWQDNAWLFALSLGLSGGLFVVLVNMMMRSLYEQRLRLG